MKGSDLNSLETPCLVLERGKLERNIARMREHLQQLGVGLRPHVKTAKSFDVARLALEGQPGGITVSTLKEAEQFLARGVKDILYAVGITENKLGHVAALRRLGADITVILDNEAAARMVVARGEQLGVRFPVLIEIDSDGHRSGVKADDPKLMEIASMLHDGGAALKGVMTHAGSSYDLDTPEALRQLAEQERHECVRAAERLRAAGKPCPEVSVGSTPTALSATKLDGVTEVRAGVYAVFDLVMANVGVCAPQDVALSVLTTVIGHQAEKGWTIVDAGWMAMSRDRGTQRQKVDCGYGAVCDADANVTEGLVLAGANHEHGIVSR